MLRYAAAVDRKDWPLMATCFTTDCTGVWNGVELDGVDAIVTYINGAASLFTVRNSMHMLTNVYVELDGDTATCETYAFSSLVGDSDGEIFLRLRGLRYRDVLVRQGGDWLIKHRDLSADWETRGPAVIP
jgi:hypothetical protein